MLNNSFGKTFPPAMVFAGYLVATFGLFGLIMGHLLSPVILLVGLFISFTVNGIDIDYGNKRYRQYSKILGIKSGKWQSYEGYPHLSILKRNFKTTTYSRANIASDTSESTFYDIFLLSESHRKKLMVQRSTTQEQAKMAAQDLAISLGVEYVQYSPKVSAATRAHTRRR